MGECTLWMVMDDRTNGGAGGVCYIESGYSSAMVMSDDDSRKPTIVASRVECIVALQRELGEGFYIAGPTSAIPKVFFFFSAGHPSLRM